MGAPDSRWLSIVCHCSPAAGPRDRISQETPFRRWASSVSWGIATKPAGNPSSARRRREPHRPAGTAWRLPQPRLFHRLRSLAAPAEQWHTHYSRALSKGTRATLLLPRRRGASERSARSQRRQEDRGPRVLPGLGRGGRAARPESSMGVAWVRRLTNHAVGKASERATPRRSGAFPCLAAVIRRPSLFGRPALARDSCRGMRVCYNPVTAPGEAPWIQRAARIVYNGRRATYIPVAPPGRTPRQEGAFRRAATPRRKRL
jgi:hypothetical protein